MSDTLRTRIAAVLHGHVDLSHRYDLADAVIRELEAGYILVPKSHTLAKAAEEWLKSDE